MKTILAIVFTMITLAALLSTTPAQKSAGKGSWSATITSQAKHESMCSTALLPNKPVPISSRTGPNCGIYVFQMADRWSDKNVAPRSPSGELVTGFRFNGWIEDGKGKILVWALLNARNSENAAVEEEKLTAQLVDTLVVKPGTTVVVDALRKYGVKPVVVSTNRSE